MYPPWPLLKTSADPLEQGFLSPPSGARPRVWWHWMSGNITEEGIGLDMEWMKRVGLGGMQNFDAALNTPKVVEKRLVYMTPEWKEAFLFATKKADSLGLELAIAGSPGWSETGGPWVESSQAMKKFVWSETAVEGGQPFTGMIAKPPMVTGPFQNLAQQDPMGMMGGPGQQPPPPKDFYADSVVIAYRIPDAEISAAAVQPKVTSSSGHVDPAILSTGDLMKSTDLPIAPVGQTVVDTVRISAAVHGRRSHRRYGRPARSIGAVRWRDWSWSSLRSQRRRTAIPLHRHHADRRRGAAYHGVSCSDRALLPPDLHHTRTAKIGAR